MLTATLSYNYRMADLQQLPLFLPQHFRTIEKADSGTFIDNMKLPIHRWFRYSAGFSAQWVESLIEELGLVQTDMLLDPFAGCGTSLLAADTKSLPSLGIEAHPFVARVARAKLLWGSSVGEFREKALAVLQSALDRYPNGNKYPKLIEQCFSPATLGALDRLKTAWTESQDSSAASELTWLAITSILRSTSTAGTAQWQYILPNKTKKIVLEPWEAFRRQIELMQVDMLVFQRQNQRSLAALIEGDSRRCPAIADRSVSTVITSPPYANNYDYADATRLEMSFWGAVQSWGDLHTAVRDRLIVSSSQHASRDKLVLDELLHNKLLAPIQTEIEQVCRKLEIERQTHGGKKHYHTMVAAYFVDLAEVWLELHRVCQTGANLFFVIGDSAPYGVYVPVDRWLGELALAAGFSEYNFSKLRDRNIKWKNRKHRVPLHEGILWIKG